MHLMWLLVAQVLCIPSPSNPFLAFARLFQISCISSNSNTVVYNNEKQPVIGTQVIKSATVDSVLVPFDVLPKILPTFSFSECPDPIEFFKTTEWEVFKVLPATKGEGKYFDIWFKDATTLFENFRKLLNPVVCDENDLLVNGKTPGPRDNIILLENENLIIESRLLYPALLKIPFVAHVNIWNLYDSRENGVEFHLDTYGRKDRRYTSAIQLHGTRTYLFYTQKNIKAAYDRYLPISRKKCFPLNPTLEKLGFLNSQISSFSDCGPGWYENLKALNQLGYFPNDLMPMEITIGPGEILVFDGSMVHATLNSKDGLASVALFG